MRLSGSGAGILGRAHDDEGGDRVDLREGAHDVGMEGLVGGQVGHLGRWRGDNVIPGPVIEGVLRASKPRGWKPRLDEPPIVVSTTAAISVLPSSKEIILFTG